MLGSCVNILLVCEARMRPDLNRSSAVWCFERDDTIEICEGITLDFYTGLLLLKHFFLEQLSTCVCVWSVYVFIKAFINQRKYVLYSRKLSQKIWWKKDFRWSLTGATKRCHAPKFMEKTSSNNHKNLELHSILLWSEITNYNSPCFKTVIIM